MFQNFLNSFHKLPNSNKSMIFLMWIYSIWWIIWWLFINIYVFQLNKEILEVLYYNLLFITSTFLWFSLLWYIMSLYRKDIKILYYVSYILFIISFLSLFFFHGALLSIFIFGMIYWLWNWAFWCAVHTQELVHIQDEKRDLYSSSIAAWSNTISIVIPLFVSFIFFLSDNMFQIDGYIILFLILPLLYLTSFLFIKNIESYTPSQITKKDVYNFFNLKKYKFWLLYIFWVALYHGLTFFIWAIIAIYLLKSEINVWLFEGIMSIISTILLIFIANKRNSHNRIKIMGYLIWLIAINYLIFVFNFNIFWYIIFTLLWIILWPLYRVSEHVYDLKIMDSIKLPWSDFYPAMILREVLLWIWRLITVWILLYIALYSGLDLESILKIWILFIPIFMFIAWVSIYFHLKYEI